MKAVEEPNQHRRNLAAERGKGNNPVTSFKLLLHPRAAYRQVKTQPIYYLILFETHFLVLADTAKAGLLDPSPFLSAQDLILESAHL